MKKTTKRKKTTIDESLTLLSKQNADCICFQEVQFVHFSKKVWEHKIITLLNMPYIYYGQATLGNKYFFGQCTCSKVPLQNPTLVPLQEFDGEGRCVLSCKLTKDFYILNTHLDVWDRTEKTRKAQIKQIEQYWNRIKGRKMGLLVGDFNTVRRKDYATLQDWKEAQYPNELKRNQKIGSSSLRYLEESLGAKEVFDELKEFSGPTKTSDTEKPKRRIDYAWFLNKKKTKIQILNASVLRHINTSDHYPLQVEFHI